MRLVGIAVAGLLLAGAPASAQYGQRPAPVGASPAEDVAEIVQAVGFEPIGAPVRRGAFHVQRARDEFGRMVRVTVDARGSRVMSVEGAGPYEAYGYGPQRRSYPGYAAIDPYDDSRLSPPGSVMATRGVHAQPPMPASPPNAAAPQVAPKAVALAPARPPVPRKRPAAAPQEAAGSVEPLQPAPQAAAPQNTAPAVPEKPAAPAMPPVAPLD